jgi:hypothetical protein
LEKFRGPFEFFCMDGRSGQSASGFAEAVKIVFYYFNSYVIWTRFIFQVFYNFIEIIVVNLKGSNSNLHCALVAAKKQVKDELASLIVPKKKFV